MRFVSGFLLALILLPAAVCAQPPTYRAEFLGEFFVAKMNDDLQMIGVAADAGNQRGFIVGAERPMEFLPLPAGMNSSYAVDINNEGVIVGAVSPSSSPEFSGRAAAWYPDGLGGYTVEVLGALPGQTLSRATAVNNLGDIVGYSSDGQYRYPVLFNGADAATDLTSTGIFDPADINDQRMVVDHSFTTKRLDLDTMVAEDLGVPAGNYLATTAAVINESNQVAGLAILTSGGNCDRVAARYTDGVGWQIFSSCGQHNGAQDMNDHGDVVMRLNVAPYVRFEDLGTHRIEDLIISENGHWYVINGFGLAIDNSRRMVVSATNSTTGQTGAILLTPEYAIGVDSEETPAPGALVLHPSAPNPFNPRTAIRFDLPAAGQVRLNVFGVDGESIRVLVDEWFPAGSQEVVWDGLDSSGRPVPSGIYFARLESGAGAQVQKLMLVR